MRVEELPIDHRIIKLLLEKGITELYPPQEEAVRKGIFKGKSLLMVAQTASGKTFLAEILAVNKALRGEGKTVYLTPLKALASEKYRDFKRYDPLGVRTALSVGDYDSSDQHLWRYDIIVTTYEKMDSLLRHKPSWFNEVSLLIVDEVHYIDDEERGPVLESLVARLKMHRKDIQLLCLSATIGNPEELADWLGCELVVSSWRPVPLKEGVYYGGKIRFSDGSVKKIVAYYRHPVFDLVADTILEDGQALVFVNSRRRAVSLAEAAARKMRMPVDPRVKEVSRELRESSGVQSLNTKLSEIVLRGVCFHHAGLSFRQREIIESAFRAGIIKVLFATPTLAAGVNLPARRVVIDDFKRYVAGRGNQPIKVLEYKQFAGRAGRPGFDEYGEAVIIARGSEQPEALIDYYIRGSPERVLSRMASPRALRRQVLAYIAVMGPSTRTEIMDFLKHTLYFRQGDSSYISKVLDDVLYFLIGGGFVSVSRNYEATILGKRVSEVYIDPLSALYLIKGLSSRERATVFGLLHLVAATPDMPCLIVRRKELLSLEETLDTRYAEILVGLEDRDRISYEEMLAEMKTALLLEDWVNEVPEQEICEKYDVGPGDIRAYVETAEWILHAFSRVCEVVPKLRRYASELRKLGLRVKHGVKEELLNLVSIPGVGRVRARKLYRAGYKSLGDLAQASVEKLARIEGIGEKLAEEIIGYARKQVYG